MDTQLSPWNRVLLEKLIVAEATKKFHVFVEPGGLRPCSLESAAGPYPEPVQSD
jgi:hypothetical protein